MTAPVFRRFGRAAQSALASIPLPYTTLFRSAAGALAGLDERGVRHLLSYAAQQASGISCWMPAAPRRKRSVEHTSELQSPMQLVCRLLLEKNKPTLKTDEILVQVHAVGLNPI